MSAQNTLTPTPAPALPSAQWKLQTLQLMNWGGFHGWTEVPFSEGTTLLTGGTGSGKSTILDAFIALLQPSDVPFNGASNEGTGRARGKEQRSLLTYLQGATATKEDPLTGRSVLESLRGGTGRPIWGAIGATYVNTDGRLHTILRIYYAKAAAAAASDIATTFATYEGRFDLRWLKPFAASRFDKRQMTSRYPALKTYATYGAFAATMHARLGIGSGAGGRKAMRLLARLQSGMQVNRVDTLYKSMVLEEPPTYTAADTALAHFSALETAYAKMEDEGRREAALSRLPELQAEHSTQQIEAEEIALLRVADPGPSPMGLWAARRERALLDEAVNTNRAEERTVSEQHRAAQAEESRLAEKLRVIGEEKRANGGAVIEQRRREIEALEAQLSSAQTAGHHLEASTRVIGLELPETREQFERLRTEAETFLETVDEQAEGLQTEHDTLQEQELAPLQTRLRDLVAQRHSLRERKAGAVPISLHRARVQLAEAAGLDPMEDLPFVAELIDIAREAEQWRRAAETTLGGFARTVLVDQERLEDFSRMIDPLQISPRINFQGVDLRAHAPRHGTPGHISGTLLFKDSPFSHFVHEQITKRRPDHLCVESTVDLRGGGPRVTRSGQTRDGRRGAHGRSEQGDIIGFTNERRLAQIEVELEGIAPEVSRLRGLMKELLARIGGLRDQKTAHGRVLETRFEEIDTATISSRIAASEEDLQRLREQNTTLAELETEEIRLAPLRDEQNRLRVLTGNRLSELAGEHLKLVDRQDGTQDAIDELEQGHQVSVTEDQQRRLDELFTTFDPSPSLATYGTTFGAMRQQLLARQDAAERAVRNAAAAMTTMFASFKERWDEPDLGTTIASAEGFRAILDRIREQGLPERQQRWRDEFATWSSDDLLGLNEAYERALDEIKDRLAPINRILETLPFGAKGRGHLRITLREVPSADVAAFRRGLRELSNGLAAESTEAKVAARFRKLREFMARIALPEGKSSSSVRDRYLDVRQHVHITALCLDDAGELLASYDSLGGKSGGESQELVAFIVGSALRYQLGDEDRDRPRYAPVFLDEGFVKADGDFAGRSIQAWKKFGFQLVIGAPEGKVSEFERLMDQIVTVVKNSGGRSFVVPMVNPDEARTESEAISA